MNTETVNALKDFQQKGDVIIVSGGRISEIIKIIENSKASNYINGIICSKLEKSQILMSFKNNGNLLYFGDSVIDYQSACKARIDFIRVTGYSNLHIEKYNGIEISHISDYLNSIESTKRYI